MTILNDLRHLSLVISIASIAMACFGVNQAKSETIDYDSIYEKCVTMKHESEFCLGFKSGLNWKAKQFSLFENKFTPNVILKTLDVDRGLRRLMKQLPKK